jgi:2,3,4,5-tetrahydropyridine-2-carboxylate N-succinyltransferase
VTDKSAPPTARGIGLATLSTKGDGTKVLDTWYPLLSAGREADPTPAVLAAAGAPGATGTTVVDADALRKGAAKTRRPDQKELLRNLADALDAPDNGLPVRRIAVVTVLPDVTVAPADAHDVYLRLHLLSSRRARPHQLSLEGQFGLLANVAWTDRGPADPDDFEADRTALRARGERIEVWGVDKFPRMTDYVVPSGVRIADTSRVRLGAHLAEGTTVMHEGFVNFNAGTLGPVMVEGRISAGVVVGADSDIGGGASIQGTLSGGGTEVITVGEGALLGANAGIGISLGDGSVVEAGLYVTAGSRVTLPNGQVVKAKEVSGRPGIMFIRNSETGVIEVRDRKGRWGALNADLHAN